MIYVPPRWFGRRRGDRLELSEAVLGHEVVLEGRAAKSVVDRGELDEATRFFARHDPALAGFETDLESSPPVPLTRKTLLKGTEWGRLFVELTGRCNERCVHCYASAGPEVGEALDWPTIARVIDQAHGIGFASIQLTGGDPLVSEHCLAAAARVRERGFRELEIYTNGLALRGALYEGLRDLDAHFAFSVYSSDPAVHDAITQVPGSLKRTSEAIRRAAADGLTLRVGIIEMAGNTAGLEATRRYVEGLGVPEDRISSDSSREVGRGDSFAGESQGAHGGRGGVAAGVPRFVGRAAVAYDGRVHPCIFSRATVLGDVRAQSLSEILEDDTPLSPPSRRLEVFGESASMACWECRLRNQLLGGAT